MRKPRGHIRPNGAGYAVAVRIGQDPITKRYSYAASAKTPATVPDAYDEPEVT